TFDETRLLIGEIMKGEMDPAQIAGILIALKIKGETPAEIGGAARALQEAAVSVPTARTHVIDTCGTGGDGQHSINISTAAAIVLAAAGQPVAKHGNRAVSSRSGSADVLEALGVAIELGPEGNGKLLDELGICFLYAPRYHLATKHVMPVRRALGTRTLFNLIGPLSNPVRPYAQVLGVNSEAMLEPMAQALLGMGAERAFVVHGAGMDELALHGSTLIIAVEGGGLRHLEVNPEAIGLDPAPPTDLTGGTAEDNAALLRDVLGGKDRGPRARAIALNAAAGLVLTGAEDDWAAAARRCLELMASGEPLRLLERWAAASRDLR
ncbi:anthranilate phosphoribosyltransferase, partial [bacterium]|nr:anthranilate phosphoribosyltransferase [bacterium]